MMPSVRRPLPPPTVYLLIEAVEGFNHFMFGTMFSVYLIVDAGLGPFELVLLGTLLEATVLLFEIPTGVLADAVSRRASVIVGIFVSGSGFVLMGTIPRFWPIVVANVLWGLGATFVSGAQVAWITDEVGEQRAHTLYLRGAQAGQVLGLAGIGASVALATVSFGLPITVSGGASMALAVALVFVMPERHFRPRHEGHAARTAFARTFGDGMRAVRRSPVLLLIFIVAAVHGMSTEGFDRLFQLHLIRDTDLPPSDTIGFVLWFGAIEAGGLVLAVAAAEYVRRRVDISSHTGAARTLAVIDILLIGTVVAFALTGNLLLAVACFWAVALLREVREPVSAAWINQGLDPASRATVNSMWSQMDAVGQIAGGPGIGALAQSVSVGAGIVGAGLLRLPTLALFARALRKGTVGTIPPERIRPAGVEPSEVDVAGIPGPPVPHRMLPAAGPSNDRAPDEE
jgi:DHA3 family tetracycline resistance protein-like MFS transporter